MKESYTKTLPPDEVGVYLKNAKERVAKQSSETRERILQDEKIWGDGESIRDYEFDCFLNRLNSIVLRKDEVTSNFFKNESRRDGEIDKFNSRGENYFVAINPLRSVSEKIDIIKDDIIAISNEINKEGILWKEKVAMLDYCKQHALSLYHALQFPRRFGISLSRKHSEAIEVMERVAVASTEAFYYHLLGHKVALDFFREFIKPLDEINNLGIEESYFKISELDNPLVILGNAYANSVKYNGIDAIIALPAGGTQPSIATKLCMNIFGNDPSLDFIPLSTHSAKRRTGEELSDEKLEEMVAGVDIKNKKVLVVEDNSNTGKTIVKITEVLKKFEPDGINVSIAELDPLRVFVKSKYGEAEVTNENHPDFDTAMGIVPITRSHLPDRQIRKVIAQKIVFRGLSIREQELAPVEGERYLKFTENLDFQELRLVYKDTLRKVGDKHGYRNPFIIAQEMIKELNPKFYNEIKNTKKEKEVLSSIATASVVYPYLSKEVRKKLEQREATPGYKQRENFPWIIEGAKEVLEKCFELASKNRGAIYIWTKGDFHKIGYVPLPGGREQGFRYKISGLEKLVQELSEKYSMPDNSLKFLSLPQKLRLIKEVVNLDAEDFGAGVFLIEDSVENIVEAKKIVQNKKINFSSFLISGDDKKNSLIDCADSVEKYFSNKKTIFVFDMDGTLLHEDFRKENQPIQIYLRMKNLGII